MHEESGGSFLTAMLHCWLEVLHESLHTVPLVYPQSNYTLSNVNCLNLKQFQLEAAEKSSQNNKRYEISAHNTGEEYTRQIYHAVFQDPNSQVRGLQ